MGGSGPLLTWLVQENTGATSHNRLRNDTYCCRPFVLDIEEKSGGALRAIKKGSDQPRTVSV